MKLRTLPNMERAGLAIVIVVLVLATLLVLCTPFLLSSRNADQASRQLFDRGESRIALDTASRHGRTQLSGSHGAAIETANGFETVDPTPWFDSLEEVTVSNRFDPEFYNANDAEGVMWDMDVTDVSGLIDLNSAPPQVFANVMSMHSRLARPLASKDKDFRVSPRLQRDVPVVLVIGGEYIYATTIVDGNYTEVTRGLGAKFDGDDNPLPGPRPPIGHAAGASVMDQRAFAPALWRIDDIEGRLKYFDASEQLADASQHCWSSALTGQPGLGATELRALRKHTSVFAGVAGGREWQRPTRLTAPVVGGQTGILSIARPRYFNEGCTIRITDGFNTELAIVQAIRGDSQLELDRPLVNDYETYEAVVSVLSRRPVNINTASKELLEILFVNLQVRGRNERIVTTEAEALAELVVESRPLTGHEDLLRRIILPAAGLEEIPADADFVPDVFAAGAGGFISALDAFALYVNALNANDFTLSFSTMPFCYSSRDTYSLSLRSTVNAKSGVERAEASREEVLHVVPQAELFSIWSLQEQFDESLRLDREAPYWATGPQATTRYDADNVPPSRLWPHMGSANGQRYLPGVIADPSVNTAEDPPTPEHIFADREEQGFAQLFPSRPEETMRTQGRVLHFDQESRDPEGRYLPDETIQYSTDDQKLQWTDPAELLCRPLFLSLWVQPRSLANATLLDIGGSSNPDVDRIRLLIENGDLVLRVLDGMGDHFNTPLAEAGELRYPLAQGNGPGLPVDIWSHIAIDVRGNRADQMTMLVNGYEHGVTSPGFSQLVGSAGPGAGQIQVESLVGFLPEGCIRIGEELIEYTIGTSGTLTALRYETGRLAGFGGRHARTRYTHERPDQVTTQPATPINLGSIDLSHEGTTPVERYGYSLPIDSSVPAGGSTLANEIGLFRVARLIGVEGGETNEGDTIFIENAFTPGVAFPLGFGIEADSVATGLILGSADDPLDTGLEFMEAFHTGGGYAAIIQTHVDGIPTVDGNAIGGIEVIRYSGRQGNILQIAARGGTLSELGNYSTYANPVVTVGGVQRIVQLGGTRAFVSTWMSNIEFIVNGVEDPGPALTLMSRQAYVVPISVPAPGATSLSFLDARNGFSEFAQLTHIDDAEFTEWVRYDWIESGSGQLVRDGSDALAAAQIALGALDIPAFTIPSGPGGPGGGGGGGGGGPGGGKLLSTTAPASAPLPASAATSKVPQSVGGPTWLPTIGEDEIDDFPLSRAVSEAMQFRGVFGTYVHKHPAGTQVLPVFQVLDGGTDFGQPGRLDSIFLVDGSAPYTDLGMSAVVHWAHRPAINFLVHAYEQPDPSTLAITASSSPPFPVVTDATLMGSSQRIYIALQRAVAGPLNTVVAPASGATAVADGRRVSRLVCFPSGELPRVVTDASIGADRTGGFVPSALVDEIVFGDTEIPQLSGSAYPAADTRGAGAVLLEELSTGATNIARVRPRDFRTSLGRLDAATDVLSTWPQDAGLVRIGGEILAYSALDANSGTITIAEGGRGMLGTEDQNHEIGSVVYLLEHFDVSTLTGALGAGDAVIPIEDRLDFPDEGTVLIGQELMHYTWVRGNVLEMPRLSEEAGAMDGGGGGIFRGRYGSEVSTHGSGSPVILFPFRYWDRWEAEADGPELSYFGLVKDEPSAFWREMFLLNQEASSGGSRMGVLVRTNKDVPWDSDPDSTPGLSVFYPVDLRNNWTSLGGQSDRIEWRVFVDYLPGAFDAQTGQSHGWRQTPRLDALGVRYLAPNVNLRSVED